MAVQHRIRADGDGTTKIMKLTARRAIIENCKECVGWDFSEVRSCTSRRCPLWPFRNYSTPKNTV